MSIPDRIHAATIREQIDLARYEAGLRKRVLGLLTRLGQDVAKELADAELDTPRTAWQRARLRDLLRLAERKASEVYGEVAALTQDEMRGLVEVAGDRMIAQTNRAIGADLLVPVNWTTEQVAAIADETLIFGARSGEWWSRQAADYAQAFGDHMRMGLLRGENLDQMVARVRSLQDISRRNAEALVRSSAISVANEAHLAAFRANADIMAGIEWTAALDKRTCTRCGALDGLRWTLDHEPIGHSKAFPGPVLHWNDRCTQIPVTKTWEELAGKKIPGLDEIPRGDRASMGGPVSGDTTYTSWFEGLDAKSQRDILGAKRYDLWSQGKIDLKGLTDQAGNELTLAELKARK